MNNAARLYSCQKCNAQVTICRHCDYGNRYCMECASIARQAARKRALARYQGRLNHAVRQSRYRERKKVTHKGSSTLRFSVPLTDGPVKIKLPSIPQARK